VRRFLIFLLLLPVAVGFASAFGILHNQISYTVAPEYFTKFKFIQFGLVASSLPDRMNATIVGFFASWWMGIPIGLLLGAMGFIHLGHWRMFKVTVWSFIVAIGFTLLFGLGGLLYGYLQTRTFDLADYSGWYLPEDISDWRRFLCAGYLHNSSYLGGVISIFIGWIFHLVIKFRTKAQPA
jgi:hypothetical protein